MADSAFGAVPRVNSSGNMEVDRFAQIVKQNIDWLSGQTDPTGQVLTDLIDAATTADIIAAINRINKRLRGA